LTNLEDEPEVEQITIEEKEIPSGRSMTPTGMMYLASQKAISQMSPEELHEHIRKFKDLVRAAERNLDYRRTHELEQRDRSLKRHLRNVKFVPGAIKIVVNSKDSPSTKWKNVVAKLKATGKTDKEIKDLLEGLKAIVSQSNKE